MITVNDNQAPFGTWTDTKRLHYIRQLVFSGNYSTGGDTVNLNQYSIKSSTSPLFAVITNSGGNKYRFSFIIGPIPNTCLVKITDTTTGLELAAGPYPAAVAGDANINLYAVTKSMQ